MDNSVENPVYIVEIVVYMWKSMWTTLWITLKLHRFSLEFIFVKRFRVNPSSYPQKLNVAEGLTYYRLFIVSPTSTFFIERSP